MSARRKRNARRQPGAAQSKQHAHPNPKGGRPEFQGNGENARNKTQRPPEWRKPAGAEALAKLAALWGPPRTRRGRS